MKTKSIWVMSLWIAGLGAGSAMLGCGNEEPPPSKVSAADKAATQKAFADKAAADKAAADRAAADKAAAAKASADKAAADKAAAAKAASDKAAADKAAADKVAADKAAAEKAAGLAKAEAAALPPDLMETKAEITRMTAQIDMTMAKLDTLAATTGDIKDPSKDALAAIDALNTEATALKARGEQMRDRGAAYFELWEKQLAAMSTPEVAEIAAKRKDELATQYTEVLTSMQEARAAMDAYWSDIAAIRKVVEEGLSPEGLQLLPPQIKAAKEKAATLKSRIETTFAKISQVSAIYQRR